MDHEYMLKKRPDGSRELTCTKMKEAEPPPAAWFDLQHVDLDWPDRKGGMQSSAVLCPAGEPAPDNPADKAARLTGAARIAHAELLALLASDGEEAPEIVRSKLGERSPVLVVHEDAWRERCYLAGVSAGDTEAKKKAFQRARQKLIDDDIVSTWAAFYWCYAPVISMAGVEKPQ
jgi:hypothetical protein